MKLTSHYDRLYKKLTIAGSVVCFIFFGLAAIEENFWREWKNYQKEYKEILVASAKTDLQKQAADNFGIQIKQVILPDLDRVDRCVSCHNGIENPQMAEQAVPHAAHSGDYLKNHPVEKFGCSICHGGQDRALAIRHAFAREEGTHWEYPVLPLRYVQSSCGKCHLAIFDKDQILAGADVLMQGRDIFYGQGCLGCHNVRGTGGSVGIELTTQGGKTKHEYSFANIAGARTVENWLLEHFLDPQKVSGVSEMPPIKLPGEELDALITFTMSLYRPDFPSQYLSLPATAEFKGQRRQLSAHETYGLMCAVCHGQNGEGKDYRVFQTSVPKLNSDDFLSVASEDMIRFTIEHGRSSRNMSAWRQGHGGLSAREIDGLVKLIRSWRAKAPSFAEVRAAEADPELGAKLFRARCGTCHGNEGQGGIGPSLNNREFLSIVSARFLYDTIVTGRRNTAMPSWSHLSARDIASITSHIFNWQTGPTQMVDLKMTQGDPKNGRTVFNAMCVGCHGKYGQGSVGPAILNPDFLAAASDEFILHSIKRGRGSSAMRSWGPQSQGLVQLSNQEMSDLVAFMRSRENTKPAIHSSITPGTPANGQVLYQGMCSGCHGVNGEGKHGPALNNQEFLAAATDGFLQATIALGRAGTAMRSWAKGAQGYEELSTEQINDIVTYIRSWQRVNTVLAAR